MNALGPSLQTERLILRPPVAEDFAGFCAFHGDGLATKFIGGVQSPPVVWRTMRTIAGGWALDGFHFFSVIEKQTGTWVGRVGPLNPHGWPRPEVGWGLLPSYWGRGYRNAECPSQKLLISLLLKTVARMSVFRDNSASLPSCSRAFDGTRHTASGLRHLRFGTLDRWDAATAPAGAARAGSDCAGGSRRATIPPDRLDRCDLNLRQAPPGTPPRRSQRQRLRSRLCR